MNVFAAKVKLVFLPLIFLGIVFVVAYSLLYFVFYLQFRVVSLKLDIVQIWLPIGLSFILTLIFIRPRVHLLKLDKDNGRVRTLYYMVGAAVFCIPAIIGLNYLDTATGKLTKLESISEIPKRPVTKYYTVNSFVLNKEKIGIEGRISYSGKHNEYLNFDMYVAIPFTADLADTIQSPPAFLSIKYHQQISSKVSEARRLDEWSEFWNTSFEKFTEEKLKFIYLESMPDTRERDNFIMAAKKSRIYNEGSRVIALRLIDEPFDQRNSHNLEYMFLSFGIGAIVWFIMILIPGLHQNKASRFHATSKSLVQRQLISAWDFVKPRPGFMATPILIFFNLLVFGVMVLMGYGVFDFYSHDLISLGAIYEPAIDQGEWWRFITGMFVHGGIIHLTMNMVSLYLAGMFLEAVCGVKKFALIYFLSGIAAGIISLWWHDKPVVAVGASGAIFGLYGVLLALTLFKPSVIGYRKVMFIFLACTAGYSLLMGFVSEGIDNSAHIGGLVSGFLLSLLFVKNREEDPGM